VAWSPSLIGVGIVTEHWAPSVPQLIPAAWMVPPAGRAMVSVGDVVGVEVAVDVSAVPAGAKVAPHVRGPSSAIAWLGAVPEQCPVHPAKT